MGGTLGFIPLCLITHTVGDTVSVVTNGNSGMKLPADTRIACHCTNVISVNRKEGVRIMNEIIDILETGLDDDDPKRPTYITMKMLEQIEQHFLRLQALCWFAGLGLGAAIGYLISTA